MQKLNNIIIVNIKVPTILQRANLNLFSCGYNDRRFLLTLTFLKRIIKRTKERYNFVQILPRSLFKD